MKVIKFEEQQNKVSASNDFFHGLSRDADLVVDWDLLQVTPFEKNFCDCDVSSGTLPENLMCD